MIKMSLLILLGSLTACKIKAPDAELCAYHSSGVLICNDKRKKPQDYERLINHGDLVTSPESFERVKSFCSELAAKLVKCERSR